MKKKSLILAVILAISPLANAASTELNSVEQKASYTLGTDLAKNFQQQGLNIDVEALKLGMQDVLNDRPLKLTQEEMDNAVKQVKKALMEKQMAKRQAEAKKNAQKGEAFLAENKNKPGVKITDSGLQYKVINKGKGPSPSENDMITAHYQGALIDGTVFDSSYERGTPLEFEMGNVIKGWQEALKMMKAGSKWELYIPAELAYGERGAGKRIPPNSTLVFTVELIKFDQGRN